MITGGKDVVKGRGGWTVVVGATLVVALRRAGLAPPYHDVETLSCRRSW
jgi:hypothetical protein